MQGYARSNYVSQLASLSMSNDDMLQLKAGALTNRTLAQVRTDLGSIMSRAIHTNASASWAATNSPNSEQAFAAATTQYTKVDGTLLRQVRLNARVVTLSASANTPRIYPQYSTDAVNYTTVGAGTVASGDAISLASTGVGKTTNWIDLPSGAKADIYWRVAENGGDGTADPALSAVYLEFR